MNAILQRGIASFLRQTINGACYLCTMAAPKKMRVVFVLGPPGSGKGTQCANIEKVSFQ